MQAMAESVYPPSIIDRRSRPYRLTRAHLPIYIFKLSVDELLLRRHTRSLEPCRRELSGAAITVGLDLTQIYSNCRRGKMTYPMIRIRDVLDASAMRTPAIAPACCAHLLRHRVTRRGWSSGAPSAVHNGNGTFAYSSLRLRFLELLGDLVGLCDDRGHGIQASGLLELRFPGRPNPQTRRRVCSTVGLREIVRHRAKQDRPPFRLRSGRSRIPCVKRADRRCPHQNSRPAPSRHCVCPQRGQLHWAPRMLGRLNNDKGHVKPASNMRQASIASSLPPGHVRAISLFFP
jgi:hypothetical protein